MLLDFTLICHKFHCHTFHVCHTFENENDNKIISTTSEHPLNKKWQLKRLWHNKHHCKTWSKHQKCLISSKKELLTTIYFNRRKKVLNTYRISLHLQLLFVHVVSKVLQKCLTQWNIHSQTVIVNTASKMQKNIAKLFSKNNWLKLDFVFFLMNNERYKMEKKLIMFWKYVIAILRSLWMIRWSLWMIRKEERWWWWWYWWCHSLKM